MKTRYSTESIDVHGGQGRIIPVIFWSKVAIGAEDDCWPWLGTLNKQKYGIYSICRFKLNGTRCGQLKLRTHTAAFELEHGKVEIGVDKICHTCDNPSCCNPKHLYRGTPQTNMIDCVNRQRHPLIGKIGEEHPRAKVTQEQVDTIRDLYASGYTLDELSSEYGLAPSTLSVMIRGKTWRLEKAIHENS